MDSSLHPASAIVEAIAALESASGCLAELDRSDQAHRCAVVASRLHIVFVEYLGLEDDEVDEARGAGD
jgi:hypothetical protein